MSISFHRHSAHPGSSAVESGPIACDSDLETPPSMSGPDSGPMLQGFNATAASYPRQTLMHELFEAHVERDPAAPAVVGPQEGLSYGELNRRANRLARYLLKQGAECGECIPIVMPRCLPMVVAQLAVLKIGCAYVPIDPRWPKERRDWMLRDCGARRAIVDGAPLLAAPGDPQWLDVARAAEAIEGCSDANLPIHADAESAAYVMYTSGSTGVPKGVLVPHRAVNRLLINNGYAEIERGDCMAHCSTPAFDASTFEVWGALLNGARLCIVPQSTLLEPERFSALLIREHVTVLLLPVGLFNEYSEELGAAFRRLKYLLVGGDVLNPRAIARVLRDNPPRHLLNAYGPTECAVISTTYRIDSVPAANVSIPIGRPVANTRIYILDEHGQPAAPMVAGEIHVGGDAVALGYLNRPQLTAERFVRDPFSAEETARMYKTGDLGRWRADGNIEFLGRNDQQVKIRGFRIELGEIEACLSQYPGVGEAVVLACAQEGGDKRLVAYYTLSRAGESDAGGGGHEARSAHSGITAAQLKCHLAESLPEHMVPSAYVPMERFPLTSNGKLDRKALPAPDSGAVLSGVYEEPVGEIETALAQAWRELLKVERIGRGDHFFELGGHSLLAIMLRSRLRRVLKVDVALQEIFAHPVLKAMAQRVQGIARSELVPMLPVSREQALPLSFAQQRLWFLAQMPGASAAYHIPLGLRLHGELDRDALKRALDRLVWRHEALRTSFRQIDEQPPVQQVGPAEGGFALQEHDLSADPHRHRELDRRVREEACRPFDLKSGPLIRGQLLKLGEHEHALLITMHHIVSDGWSMGILHHELNTLYAAFHAGREDRLAPPPIQYADYAMWERRWLSGDVLQRQIEYWSRTLQGAPALLELPTDRPRPAQQEFSGDVVGLELDAALTRGLKALGQRHGMTLYMMVLAGWAAVLSRLSGQEEVVVGTPVANRTCTEIEGLIGFFVNTQALRLRTCGSVRELLEDVRARTLEAQENQDLPFEQVVEILKAPRSLSHTPVFQVMLAWQNEDRGGLDFPGLTLTPIEVGYGGAKFDLTLELSDAGDRVVGGLRYVTALFERATIERHVGYLRRMLTAMLADEQQRIDAIDLLSEPERDQLLRVWNETACDYPLEQTLGQLFEAQVRRTPDQVAVVFEDQALSYAELNAKANQLAHRLRAEGVGADVRVGLCLERSIEMVVGLLGILKAGGAYVPLDPSYPAERLAYMLEDSAPAVLLTQASVQSALPLGAGAASSRALLVLDAEQDRALIAAQPSSNPSALDIGLTSRHLAYVIYTSGSTGRPKGVMVEQRSVANVLCSVRERAQIGPQEVVASLASLSFDIAATEILLPLMTGARVVVCDSAAAGEPQALAALLEREQVSLVQATPATWRHLLEEAPAPLKRDLKIFSTGEALSADLAGRLLARFDRLWNLYGPTETCIYSSLCRVQTSGVTPALGRPVAGTRLYILDERLNLVPIGVRGELYIGGVGLARGYLNRPDLTAERFRPDPFGPADSRMYRTGDAARYRADGTLEYLGRLDHQVKIRGFRIELGEVEAALLALPEIRAAVVIARDLAPENKQLVAYVVAHDAATALEISGLRAALSRRLPEYMLPAHVVVLAELPLTPNGKLDSKALPAPEASSLAGEYVAPRSDAEKRLASIWAELLRLPLERIGLHDDFFVLGGHSLLAVQMMSRVNREFGTHLPMHAVFEHKTVARLAAAVQRSAGDTSARETLRHVELAEGVEPTYAQQAMLRDPTRAGFNMCRAVWLEGVLDENALRRSLEGLLARQDALRATFAVQGAAVRMHVQAVVPDVLHIATLENAAGSLEGGPLEGGPLDGGPMSQWLASEIRKERLRPFNLQEGPPVRALLIRICAQKHVLVLSVHHVVADMWSIDIIKKDLAAFYAAELDGSRSRPGPLPIGYGDFVHWQRRLRDTDEYQRQLGYWLNEFANLAPQGAFPVRPEPCADKSSRALQFEVADDWHRRVTEFATRQGLTSYVILVAALHVALADYSGLEQQLVWTPISRRTRVELEDSVGLYSNLIAIAERVKPDLSAAEFLALIERKVLLAHANGDVSALTAVMKNPSVRPALPVIGLNFISLLNGGDWDFPGTTATPIEVITDEALMTALEVEVLAAPDEMKITVGYNTDIFDIAAVRQIVQGLMDAADRLIGDPGSRLADLMRRPTRAAMRL